MPNREGPQTGMGKLLQEVSQECPSCFLSTSIESSSLSLHIHFLIFCNTFPFFHEVFHWSLLIFHTPYAAPIRNRHRTSDNSNTHKG